MNYWGYLQTILEMRHVVPRLEATLGVCRRISGGTEVQLTDCIACSLLANLCMKRLIYLMFMFDR